MKKLLIILILCSCFNINQNVLATPQVPDYLIYNGDTLTIESNPLETYFEDHPRPDSLLSSQSSACWRGYIAFWKIENDSLFLEKMVRESGEEIDFSAIFNDRDTNKKIHADWCSYTMTSHFGELMFQNIHEYDREFIFKKGVVIDQILYDNSKTLKHLFNLIQEHIDYSNISTSTDKTSKVYVKIKSVSDEGKIEIVEILKGVDRERNLEAVRVIKLIPEWGVLNRLGKQIYLGMIIPIHFKSITDH